FGGEPAEIAPGECAFDQRHSIRELAIEMQKKGAWTGNGGVGQRRTVANGGFASVSAVRDRRANGEIRVSAVSPVGVLLVENMAGATIHRLTGEGAGHRKSEGDALIKDRIASAQWLVDIAIIVRKKKLRESCFEEQAFSGESLGRKAGGLFDVQ